MAWRTFCAVVFLYAILKKAESLDVVYLSNNCNATVTASTSGAGLLEPDSSLYYKNNQDCQVILATDSPEKRLLLQFSRFSMEEPIDGQCLGSLRIYDGPNTTSSALMGKLCGWRQLGDVVSSGGQLLFDFQSDADGRGRGFGIFYTVFTNSPCDSTQFNCTNGRCITGSLQCDSYDMCRDGSDEANCEVQTQITSNHFNQSPTSTKRKRRKLKLKTSPDDPLRLGRRKKSPGKKKPSGKPSHQKLCRSQSAPLNYGFVDDDDDVVGRLPSAGPSPSRGTIANSCATMSVIQTEPGVASGVCSAETKKVLFTRNMSVTWNGSAANGGADDGRIDKEALVTIDCSEAGNDTVISPTRTCTIL